jgi:type VI secretion system protein ImpF
VADSSRPDRFAPPLMQVFREANRARDAKKSLDLRDDAGNRILAGRRSSPRRMTNEQALRRELSEDLSALLNTVNLASAIDIEDLTHVRSSIVNYGLTDLSKISIDEEAVNGVGAFLRDTLTAFEPRLVAETLHIERDGRNVNTRDLKVRFGVHAELHATPLDIPVDFVAELELDSAKMKLSKL